MTLDQEGGSRSLMPAGTADTTRPTTLYILPLTERPFFPPQTFPLLLGEEFWLETVKKINKSPNRMGGLLLSKRDTAADCKSSDFYTTGTLIRIHHPVRTNKKIQFIAEGHDRFQVTQWLTNKPPFLAAVTYPQEPLDATVAELKAYAIEIIHSLKELIPLNPLYSEELKFFLNRFVPNDPSPLADFAASLTSAKKEQLQAILDTVSLRERMEKVILLIKKEIEMMKLQVKIRQDVEEKMTQHQRNFFLKEQLKIIQQELGMPKDDKSADMARFKALVEALSLPTDADKRINDELSKLSILETNSPEYALTRNYLEILTTLPFGKFSKDNCDIEHAKHVLDDEHEGLDDIKERIVEFIAVAQLKGEFSGSIICLVGPPGVGKTSIGRSLAHALDRKFFRFSVGGMRDEAEIKGHRRTYVGAMPGKLIQAIRTCETLNPVIMLDEIDKMGASFQGDPASALLEVLDPEQNHAFMDHYLDLPFDLSHVLFVCTANQLDTIPRPLLDRMEVMRLSGYITAEKIAIAKAHLWPRQVKQSGIKNKLRITDGALIKIIEGYAREAGVRGLEKKLGQIVRKIAVKLVNKSLKKPKPVTVRDIPEYLGKPLYQKAKPMTGIGIATGLAWTALGGVTLDIEASCVHRKSHGFKLTGKLGEVMRESAEIAYSYLISNLKRYKAKPNFFADCLVHLHVPEGAIPKDGPSAGITMACALLSLARQEKIARPLAMTGELTLTGYVLAVGGIREKIVAAKRSGISEVILPEACRGDFEELPDHIQAGLTVHFVKHFRQIYALIFSLND